MNIRETLLGAFGYVLLYKGALSKSLAIPFILLTILNSVELEEPNSILVFFLMFALLAIHTVFAITTHRVILIGPNAVPKWGMYKFTKRELNFALHLIAMGLLIIPLGLFSVIPVIGIIIGIVLIFYVISRLSLVFPAIATDNKLSFSESWDATKNHQFPMLVVVGIFPILVGIPEVLLSYIPYTDILAGCISAFTTVFVVSALSVSFKIITKIQSEN